MTKREINLHENRAYFIILPSMIMATTGRDVTLNECTVYFISHKRHHHSHERHKSHDDDDDGD